VKAVKNIFFAKPEFSQIFYLDSVSIKNYPTEFELVVVFLLLIVVFLLNVVFFWRTYFG
jgi:hypothetical protein